MTRDALDRHRVLTEGRLVHSAKRAAAELVLEHHLLAWHAARRVAERGQQLSERHRGVYLG